jgi:hypothetical protein
VEDVERVRCTGQLDVGDVGPDLTERGDEPSRLLDGDEVVDGPVHDEEGRHTRPYREHR